MRRIKTRRYRPYGVTPCVCVYESDWRKIRRVLRAADEWKDDRSSLRRTIALHEAIDALNKEPKK